MKKRNGFVSNSSSSSFIIKKEDINQLQLERLLDHSIYEKYGSIDDAWIIDLGDENSKYIIGSTGMDNFDMSSFCFDNGIPVKFFGDEYDAKIFVFEEARFDDN